MTSSFRILYANDIHFSGTLKPHYPKTALTWPEFYSLLHLHADECDLLVVGGDAVNRGPARIDELEQFHAALVETGIPFQVVAGNHDLSVNNQTYPNWLDDVMSPEKSLDAEHDTLEAYHWGNPDERDFVIQRR